jgi:uncharacterized protein (TIGR02996 family)
MNDPDGLLAAIREDPDDDLPRHARADRMEERGDTLPRELLILSARLQQLCADSPEDPAVEQTRKALQALLVPSLGELGATLQKHKVAIGLEPPEDPTVPYVLIRDGLPYAASLTARLACYHGLALSQYPIVDLRITNITPDTADMLCESPLLRTVRKLVLEAGVGPWGGEERKKIWRQLILQPSRDDNLQHVRLMNQPPEVDCNPLFSIHFDGYFSNDARSENYLLCTQLRSLWLNQVESMPYSWDNLLQRFPNLKRMRFDDFHENAQRTLSVLRQLGQPPYPGAIPFRGHIHVSLAEPLPEHAQIGDMTVTTNEEQWDAILDPLPEHDRPLA